MLRRVCSVIVVPGESRSSLKSNSCSVIALSENLPSTIETLSAWRLRRTANLRSTPPVPFAEAVTLTSATLFVRYRASIESWIRGAEYDAPIRSLTIIRNGSAAGMLGCPPSTITSSFSIKRRSYRACADAVPLSGQIINSIAANTRHSPSARPRAPYTMLSLFAAAIFVNVSPPNLKISF